MMADINYKSEAELFPARRRSSTRGPIGYKRFKSAAEAICFAMEELPGSCFSAPTSRWTRKGLMATEFAVSTLATPFR